MNNILCQVVIQSKTSPYNSNSFRRESISNLPGGMALFVSLNGTVYHHQNKG